MLKPFFCMGNLTEMLTFGLVSSKVCITPSVFHGHGSPILQILDFAINKKQMTKINKNKKTYFLNRKNDILNSFKPQCENLTFFP